MRLAPVARACATAALAVVLLAPPAAADSAINPSNKPTPVPGRTNAQLPPEDLVLVQGPACRAYRAAASSLFLMFQAAERDGVALRGNSCYRQYSQQVGERAAFGPCAAPPGTSMHGWGKAIDFADAAGGLGFNSRGYQWLRANAAAYGWNFPGWAAPGGSGCDEPWHWEWVGDGGTMGGDPIKADVTGVLSSPSGSWWSVTGLGAVTPSTFGGAEGLPLQRLVVGGAGTAAGDGYWLVAGDGGVFSYGSAPFHGSMGGQPLNKPIVGMAATPTGGGYWMVASDGGIFSFGDAGFHGSMGGQPLNKPVVGMAATPTGAGYWLVASDGGIFSFGDAGFAGSMGGEQLNRPVVGMAPADQPNAYWMVASDGGVFSFGGAPFKGSLGGQPTAPVSGMAKATGGYHLVAVDGKVTTFSS